MRTTQAYLSAASSHLVSTSELNQTHRGREATINTAIEQQHCDGLDRNARRCAHCCHNSLVASWYSGPCGGERAMGNVI